MKLPFDFGIRFILRLVAPGALFAAICLPLVRIIGALVYPKLGDLALFATSGLVFGFALLLLDMPIYMLLEGRRFWPRWLRRLGVGWQADRLRRLKAASDKATGSRQIELDIQAWRYPIDRVTGEPHATHPTRLGNVLASFETYPTVKYGLDGVFYWPRLWVAIDKDLREELDSAQAVVDGAIYCTFVFGLSTFVCLGYWALLPVEAWWHWPAGAAACLAFAVLTYRLALPCYAQYGDLFMAAFDQHRDKLKPADFLRDLDAHVVGGAPQVRTARETNRAAWRFLRWHTYRRPGATGNETVRDW